MQRLPVKPQPAYVLHDALIVKRFLALRIGVVKAQIGAAAELLGHAEVDADGLGVANVQKTIGFGWKAGDDATVIFAGSDIFADAVADKMGHNAVVLSAMFWLAGIVWAGHEVLAICRIALYCSRGRRQ